MVFTIIEDRPWLKGLAASLLQLLMPLCGAVSISRTPCYEWNDNGGKYETSP